MSRRRGAGRNSLHDSRQADATRPDGRAGDSVAGGGVAVVRGPAATTGGGPSWRRWAILVSLAVAAAAAILLVSTTPSREEPLPGDGVEATDPQVARLYERAREGVRAEPSSAEAWGDLGLVLAAHGHASDATTCLARAAVLAPADWRWPCFRAAVESDIDLARAVETIAEAIRRDPRQEWPRLFRARWLEQLGRAAEAEPIYRGLIADMPGHALAAVGLARVLVATDRIDEAAAAIAPALDHPSTRRAARELVARIEGRRGDLDAAESVAAAARELPPDAPWAGDPLSPLLAERRGGKHDIMARALESYEAGDEPAARELTAKLVADHPEIVLLLQGRRQLAAGNAVAAEQAFRKAIALDPAWVELAYRLGTALAAQGRLPEAATVFREVLAKEPSYPAAWNELAKCLDATDPAAAREARANAARYSRGAASAAGGPAPSP